MKTTMLPRSWFAGALVLLITSSAHAYYSPQSGRWLSRDPIEEDGGPSLYGFNANAPQGAFDALGQCSSCPSTSWVGLHPITTDPPVERRCGGSLRFSVLEPRAVSTANEVRKLCGQRDQLTAACSWANGKELSYSSECRLCDCHRKWKVILDISTTCNIVYADPNKVRVSYPQGLGAVINHEKCHCDDWRDAFQSIIGTYDAIESSTKEQCEIHRANIAKVFASQLAIKIWPSQNHRLGKYERGRECFAQGNLLE